LFCRFHIIPFLPSWFFFFWSHFPCQTAVDLFMTVFPPTPPPFPGKLSAPHNLLPLSGLIRCTLGVLSNYVFFGISFPLTFFFPPLNFSYLPPFFGFAFHFCCPSLFVLMVCLDLFDSFSPDYSRIHLSFIRLLLPKVKDCCFFLRFLHLFAP